jgi:hypothetical protein
MVGMWKTDLRIELTEEERDELERMSRSLVSPHRVVERARTILLLGAGGSVSAVARQVGRGRRIVRKWGGAVSEEATAWPRRSRRPRSRGVCTSG